MWMCCQCEGVFEVQGEPHECKPKPAAAQRWFTTRHGVEFDPFDPSPEAFRVDDVAHSLSMLCRFNGHTREFYSVAQHSVLVSHLVPPEFAYFGLMHDAVEAYTGDMVRPIKLQLPDFLALEAKLEQQASIAFGLAGAAAPEAVRKIKEADRAALLLERYALFDPSTRGRFNWFGVEPGLLEAQLARNDLERCTPCFPLEPRVARDRFLSRYVSLAGHRA